MKPTMNRREFLRRIEGALVCSVASNALVQSSLAVELISPAPPLNLGHGPQLFLDDYIIERFEGLKREVQSPQRFGKPVLESKTFGTTQPYVTVLRDEDKKLFRIWYNRGSSVWHAESGDGINWADPKEVWNLSHAFGASLLDDGALCNDPQKRFKLANWQATRVREDKPGDDGGMWLGFSPDGLHWTGYDKNPVLPTWPDGYGKYVSHGASDIVDVYYDPLRKLYGVALKVPALAEDGYTPGPRAGQYFRRLVAMSTSKDFIHWEKPWRILAPDSKDDGLLEFYGMGGIHLRGGLYIGLVRVLRDDLSCDPDGPKNGIGYAALATSRDGVTWQRYREPFLDRNPEPGSWDHAMTWISYALPVGDEMYFYYAGYARGHKIEPGTERQIGMARMKKDRYVALVPTNEAGKLLTRPFVAPTGRLTVNSQVPDGLNVRVLGLNGKALAGFAKSKPITGDVLAGEVHWPKSLESLQGKPVRLEFQFRKGTLFGFEFHA